jgi:hypothetical protein
MRAMAVLRRLLLAVDAQLRCRSILGDQFSKHGSSPSCNAFQIQSKVRTVHSEIAPAYARPVRNVGCVLWQRLSASRDSSCSRRRRLLRPQRRSLHRNIPPPQDAPTGIPPCYEPNVEQATAPDNKGKYLETAHRALSIIIVQSERGRMDG